LLDNDGDLDLAMVPSLSVSGVWRNTGGKFTKLTAPTLTQDGDYSVGVVWSDINNDGYVDISCL